MKRALITGITGQDGSYLLEFLLNKGYEVHGMKRRSSQYNTERLDHIIEHPESYKGKFFFHYGDMGDSMSLLRLMQKVQPDEVYNLAAQSHVKVSFDLPQYTANVDALGTLNLLETIRLLGWEKRCRFYQAGTSELYGLVQETPQRESTPFYPRSPYAVAKLYAYWITVNYREAYDLFAVNGILFNHESPRRGESFVTRKITIAVGKIANGRNEVLRLGNLDAKRDWGFAADYVEAMWLMLQQEKPKDLVIATGVTTTIRRFCELAFAEIGLSLCWEGEGVDEKGFDQHGTLRVEVSPQYFRPTEVDLLVGDASRASEELGWKPKMDLQELVKVMVRHDVENISKGYNVNKTLDS